MNTPNSQGVDSTLKDITTAEGLLERLRKGNAQSLELAIGDFKVPCRLISASEEATLAVKASIEARKKNPTGEKQDIFESYETMKAILVAATNINGSPTVPPRFFELLSNVELVAIFDNYQTLNHTINPSLADMTDEQITQIVDDIKKKKAVAKDFYTWQLAAVGKFFLERVIPSLQMDSGVGSA